MQRYWHNDDRFSAKNFGNQPIWLIFQALDWGARLHHEELHLTELGIATLSALFVNANRDPKKSDPANAKDFFYFTPRENEVHIPSEAADAFFSLAKDEYLPSWALSIAPVERLRSSKGSGRFARPRAWIGDGVLLILPRIVGKSVKCPLAMVRSTGIVSVEDVDSGTQFWINLPEGEARWCLDAEIDLEESKLILK